MSLIHITWGILIVLIFSFGINVNYNSDNKDKYIFYNAPIEFGMVIVQKKGGR